MLEKDNPTVKSQVELKIKEGSIMDKALLTNAELELTQKIQLHFPRGVISPQVIKQWNSCSVEQLTNCLQVAFGVDPQLSEIGDTFVEIQKSPTAIDSALLPPKIEEKPTTISVVEVPRRILTWREGTIELYQKFMDIDVTAELEKFAWPEKTPEGFNWFVFRPHGLTTPMALDKLCKPQFQVCEYIDVDQYSLERDPGQSHLVLCRETVEPDKEWLGKSGDDMSATAKSFLDICDRSVLEATYFLMTGKHLDIKGYTRCPRSRCGGRVAGAGWGPCDREFGVGAGHHGGRRPASGGREAIGLSLKTSS